jgi:flagellar hook-basal body complex protein FliE
MTNFNPELVKALAHGDAEAREQIKDLPLTMRMALGTAVDQLRRDENIVPMSSGFSIYEQKKVTQEDQDALGSALATIIQRQKNAEERQEKVRQEQLEKEIKAKVERARAGLAMTNRR